MFNIKDSGFGQDSTNVTNSFKNKDRDSHSKFSNQIVKAQLKQLEFLRHKCHNLKNTLTSTKNQNNQLKKQNNRLIALNSQYLNNINVFYEKKIENIQKVVFPEHLTSSKSQLEASIKDYIKRALDGFKKLQNDHRRLIKHCVVVQKQNIQLKDAFDTLRRMKQQLLSVNHTDIIVLVNDMKQTQNQNQRLRQFSNHQNYKIQKLTLDLNKITQQYKQIQKQSFKDKKQLTDNRARINKFTQQIDEKQNNNQRMIYQLQVKCNQLQKQLRTDQIEVFKMVQQNDVHQVQKVEFVQRQQSLMRSMRQLVSIAYLNQNTYPLVNKMSIASTLQNKKPRKKSTRASRSLSLFR